MFRATFCCVLALFCGGLQGAELVFDFSELKGDELPPGFTSILAGSGSPGQWQILHDEVPSAFPRLSSKATTRSTQPVLAQVSRDPSDERFPMLIYDRESFSDFTVTTRFKLVAGQTEQMAGLAFRFQDTNNYYYIRASALGNNFNFFKMFEGIRHPPKGVGVALPTNVWHEMKVECQGNQIRAWLNGKEAFPPIRDVSFGRGKIGFWTKSDSVSYFAETRITYTPREILAQVLINETLARYPRVQGIKIYGAPPGDSILKLIASNVPAEIGQPAPREIADVIARGQVYEGKDRGLVSCVLPLHDANGEPVAAVKLVMKAFPGQTEKNALTRALPLVKRMEARVRKAPDLFE